MKESKSSNKKRSLINKEGSVDEKGSIESIMDDNEIYSIDSKSISSERNDSIHYCTKCASEIKETMEKSKSVDKKNSDTERLKQKSNRSGKPNDQNLSQKEDKMIIES